MIALKHLSAEERARVLTELGSKLVHSSPTLTPASVPALLSSVASSSNSQSPSPPSLLPPALPAPLQTGSTEILESKSLPEELHIDNKPQEEPQDDDEEEEEEEEAEEEEKEEPHQSEEEEEEAEEKDGVNYIDETEAMTRATRLYFLYNYLDEPIKSGFFAVPREFVQLPTLKELRLISTLQKPSFNSTMSHTFLVDFADEKVIALRKEAAERLAATRSKRFAAKVKELLVVLRERFPHSGPYAAQTEVANLTREKKSMVLSVGSLKKLSHEELAILFKLLCEDAHIECRVVRGKNPQNKDCAWGFVREDAHQKWNLVSVVSGTMVTNSMEAQEYTREGGSDNGAPPDGLFPSTVVTETLLAAAVWKLEPHLVVLSKSNKPLIHCHCHLYEETSPMVTCVACKRLMHGPCQGYSRIEDLPSIFKCVACVADHEHLRSKQSLEFPRQMAPLPVAPKIASPPSHHQHQKATTRSPPFKDPLHLQSFATSPPLPNYSVSFDEDVLEIPELPDLPVFEELPELPPLQEVPKTPRPSLKLKLIMKSPEGTAIETQLNVESPLHRGRKKKATRPDTDDDYDDSSLSGTPDDEGSSAFSSAQISSGDEGEDDGQDEMGDEGMPGGEDENDGNWGGRPTVTRTPSGTLKRGRPAMPNSKRSQKPKPDPHAPPKPISCYHHFCKEVREDLLKTRTDVSYPVIGQIAGDR